MTALSTLLQFREMTDTFTTKEFNLFAQTFCAQFERHTLLQIIFDGLYKKGVAKNINTTFDIAQQIIDSRTTDELEKEKTNINRLSSSVIQYITSYLSLQNVFNFEKCNRFIAYSVKSPWSIKYIIDNDHQIFHKWLEYKFPMHRSLKWWYASDFRFLGRSLQYYSSPELYRFQYSEKLCFILNDSDESTYLGEASQALIKILDVDNDDTEYQSAFNCYLENTIFPLLNLFKNLTYLNLTYNISFHNPWTNIYVINNNCSKLRTIILKDHHPIKMITLFQNKNSQHIEAFPELEHFALININNNFDYYKTDMFDSHDNMVEMFRVRSYARANPFYFVNYFLMHFLPNVNLMCDKMYPTYSISFKKKVFDKSIKNALSSLIYTEPWKLEPVMEKEYYNNITIPQSKQVAGYKYLTIDNVDLNFTNESFFRDNNLADKLLKLFQNAKMVQESFKQIRGICASNLHSRTTNTYHLVSTILKVHSDRLKSLHIHNVNHVNIPYTNVEELCCNFDLSVVKVVNNFKRLKRLQINVFDLTETRLSMYTKTLISIFHLNSSLQYLGINFSFKNELKDKYDLGNVIKMLQNVFRCMKYVRYELKIKLNVTLQYGITLCDDEIRKLFGLMEQISDKNCMLLFTFKSRYGIETKIENLMKTFHYNDEAKGFCSFALSSAKCKIEGFAEHWELNCKICKHAKSLLIYKWIKHGNNKITRQ
eukprot:552603_1